MIGPLARVMWRLIAIVVGAAFGCLVTITLLAADWLIWQMLFTRYDERWIRPTKRPSSWPKGLKTELLLRQDHLCVYCGQRKNSPSFEIDHLDPARRGGPNDPDNLQALCKPCNRRKWAMTDREFRKRYARLVPATALTPPPYPVSQAAFTRETLRTDEPAALRRLRRRGSVSPRRRVVIGSLVCGVATFFGVLFGLSQEGASGYLQLVPALVAGGCVGLGLLLRSRATGVMAED